MTRDSVRRVQRRLAELGHYTGAIDGLRGPKTHAAAEAALAEMDASAGLPEDWRDWSDKRKFIAFLQCWARQEDIDAGPIDGWWGPSTDYADEALALKLATGKLPDWRDRIGGSDANPNGFPHQNDLTAFYGPNGTPTGRRPPLVRVTSPWTFKIAWNQSAKRSFLWAHEKCAASLERVLGNIMSHYGEARIEELGLDIFSGDYNARRMRGSRNRWSTHSWGIAYDFDDSNNQLRWGADRARFARPEYDAFWKIWEEEGWVSLGRTKNYDWMHVQAARVD